MQVKTGTKRTNKDGSTTVPVTDESKSKWAAAQVPVPLVYVKLAAVMILYAASSFRGCTTRGRPD